MSPFPPNRRAPFEYSAAGESHPDFQTSVSGDKRRSSHHWRMPPGRGSLLSFWSKFWSETFLYKRKHAWKITHRFPLHLRVRVCRRRVEQQSRCIRTTFWRHKPGLEELQFKHCPTGCCIQPVFQPIFIPLFYTIPDIPETHNVGFMHKYENTAPTSTNTSPR